MGSEMCIRDSHNTSMKYFFTSVKIKEISIIHAVAYADKTELNGRYIDTSKDNFINCLDISCYSLTNLARAFEPILNDGGSILTLSFYGSNKVIPNYNLMGVAKAALETSVKYLSIDLGEKNIRVNAISAGPLPTLAARSINGFNEIILKAALKISNLVTFKSVKPSALNSLQILLGIMF